MCRRSCCSSGASPRRDLPDGFVRNRARGALDAPSADRQVVDAFVTAARDGDFAGLLAVLNPDVVLRADDGSGALRIIDGARTVAAGLPKRFFAAHQRAIPVIVDGAAGLVAAEAGAPVAVLRFSVADRRITGIDVLADRARLASLGVGALVATA